MAAWLAIGALVVGTVITLVKSTEPEVVLPPVLNTELAQAAERADCRLHRGGRPASAEPPVEGPSAAPAHAGTYGREPPSAALVGALRRGTVVIYYRPGMDEDHVDRLEELQRALPRGTILAPKDDMPYRLAVTAWRRLLGCQTVGDETVDAIQLFRGRYVGLGSARRH